MTDAQHRTRLRLGSGPRRDAIEFALGPAEIDLAALAELLDVISIRKLRFTGLLRPQGQSGWELDAELGATIVQSCVATLEPVTTRIDETVRRRYVAGSVPHDLPLEQEIPEDVDEEPLPASLDLAALATEALALAVPPFPRADGAPPADLDTAPPGAEPIRDEELKPFAGLKDALKRGN
ncbi:uncharacterized metal-binding protein YceD (DUF177 family) [Palleronia aestuarii]|uniref:Uncharacterized metal-binding protein YceD (DUF177 family) n=1 Tax=Palleronia aestuarii TaxID=568105 RepID=A0A2W7NLK8_9RHOB|nr:YceD family protein [Palleronia aestuarii]PZX17554.1 uncharacterized metal-binding protein YceD (DUF177 family) [Palleronia aestuarii]